MSEWYYNNELYDPTESDLSEYVGFVYIITEKETNMKYVGKKLFHRRKTLPVTKTRKRKKKILVESDWREYFGSSENVKLVLVDKGSDAFHREILHLCKTKGDCSYMEMLEQVQRNVLADESYYNGIINVRINRSHLSPHLREKLLKNQ